MNKPKMTYFEKEDILHLVISDESESASLELSPNITAELNENGELIGIEILNAIDFIKNTILDANFAEGCPLANVQTT
ncbi:DNA polymerase III subunit alpha [Candidatus Poribacteria bacterium]|nr:MAG: DNA polymerase III subunit alpha [Candidatus Poribacteria bacterium]